MKDHVISVTAAARSFADCVNRVRYQGASFLLQKNGVSVARIVPVDPATGLNLADVLDQGLQTKRSGLVNQQTPKAEAELSGGHRGIAEPVTVKRTILNW